MLVYQTVMVGTPVAVHPTDRRRSPLAVVFFPLGDRLRYRLQSGAGPQEGWMLGFGYRGQQHDRNNHGMIME